MLSDYEIEEVLEDNRHLQERSSELICQLEIAKEALYLISTGQDRGFGINYAQGCARGALDDIGCGEGAVRIVLDMQKQKVAQQPIRTAATLIGKAPSTLHRWKKTNPHLFNAVMEYASRNLGDRNDLPKN